MRLALSLLAAAVTLYAGAWARAEFALTDRVRQVALDARDLCSSGQRGTDVAAPSPESIAQRFVSIAAKHEIAATEVAVRFERLEPGAGGGFAAGIMDQLAATTGGKVKMEMTQVTLLARVRGERWLWSVDKPFETRCLVHGRVERVLPGAP